KPFSAERWCIATESGCRPRRGQSPWSALRRPTAAVERLLPRQRADLRGAAGQPARPRAALAWLVDDRRRVAKEELAQDEAHGKSGEEDLAGVFLRPRADLPRRFLGIVAAELQATPERLRFLGCGSGRRCDSRHRQLRLASRLA